MALIGWWPLNGDAKDYSVNQNHGTATNVTWENGKIGECAKLISYGSRVDINPISGDVLTLAAWHKWDPTSSTWRDIFANTGNRHHLIFNNDRSLNVFDGETRSLGYSVPDNEWHHYIVVFENNSKATLYVDGEYKGFANINLDTYTYPINIIGNWGSSNYPSGYLNDVRIYDHALSQKEINDLYKGLIVHYTFNKDDGDIVYDNSGFRNNIFKIGNPVWQPDSSYSMSGTNYFKTDSLRFTGIREEFSISIIAKASSASSNDGIVQLTGPSGGAQRGILVGLSSGDISTMRFRHWNDGTGITNAWSSNIGNKYTHIVITVKDGIIKAYEDGELKKTSSKFTLPFNLDGTMYIGAYITDKNYFDGNIKDIRIYSTVLSDEDILDLYQTKVKLDDHGNLYGRELVEVNEVDSKMTRSGNILTDELDETIGIETPMKIYKNKIHIKGSIREG